MPSSAGRRSAPIGIEPVRRPPERTCVACRATRPKRELVRVVRPPAGGALAVDLRGKAPGRGAYLCPDEACLTKGIGGGALRAALETDIDEATREALAAELRRAAETRTKGGS